MSRFTKTVLKKTSPWSVNVSLLFFSLESVHNIVRKDQKDGLCIIWSLGESFGPLGVLCTLLSAKELSFRPVTAFS